MITLIMSGNKVSKGVGILTRLRHLLPKHVLLTLYNTLILPYLSYCNVVWGSTFPTRIQPLFVLQKRCMRLITNKHRLYHSNPLFVKLRTLSIYNLNRYYTNIFMYNWLHDNCPLIFKDYFHFRADYHSHDTRYSRDLSTPLCRLHSSHCNVRYLGVKLWNSLPEDVKDSRSIYTFKRKLKGQEQSPQNYFEATAKSHNCLLISLQSIFHNMLGL
ncbi:hypothetical protein HOLleu_32608 [Holothuria leucospilota]|uniref:Tick transposon n=1 Tax=Holothuria leucospilota TaxID=206669 RepID=A0A9Q1BIY6_HOLLE|nr:hypothetical protein HOLleu_32608 [Holothuria leucospilota]